ncbi:hypothetical protein FHE66_05285 [Georgenia sp. 311]|uniref:WXG100 family type VII secretion target n=1 Tax=Georgenia sp. 311 TaxID=2585134 RepID=UPI0011122E90|nr:hypothetical protein [Georgenia sp. 311]TNC18795.1 hypothetical protein FHE66_05285 [Georgenia sp. 311]
MGLGEAPEELRALAARMDDVVAQVRDLGADLVGLREQIGWQSLAAEEYRESLLERAEVTGRSAERVEDVAAALRAHADGVEDTLAAIESARTFLLSAFDDARSVLSDLWNGVIDAVTPGVERAQEVVDLVTGAPSADIDLEWIDRARRAGWPA